MSKEKMRYFNVEKIYEDLHKNLNYGIIKEVRILTN